MGWGGSGVSLVLSMWLYQRRRNDIHACASKNPQIPFVFLPIYVYILKIIEILPGVPSSLLYLSNLPNLLPTTYLPPTHSLPTYLSTPQTHKPTLKHIPPPLLPPTSSIRITPNPFLPRRYQSNTSNQPPRSINKILTPILLHTEKNPTPTLSPTQKIAKVLQTEDPSFLFLKFTSQRGFGSLGGWGEGFNFFCALVGR